jgi:hypothetical protein
MNPYSLALFFHFFGMLALFIGYGLEWTASSLLRRATTSDQARAWLRVYKVSLPVSGPGLLLLIITGGYLASVTGGMMHGWINASLVGIVVALGIGFALILPRIRAIRAALPEGNVALTPEAQTRLKDPFVATLVRIRAVLALGIVYLMTTKVDSLATSLIILCVAIVIGALCAATTWSRSAA